MRPRYLLLLIAIIFFLMLGMSLAHEEPSKDQGSGNQEEIISGCESGGIDLTGLEGEEVENQETIDVGPSASGYMDISGGEDALPMVLEGVIVPDIIPFDIPMIPSLIISEVFFDGSDEWLEITNRGTTDFSGGVILTGIGVNATINSFIGSKQSIVVARSGRTFGYFLDQSIIKNYISMGFTDTKQISFSLIYSGIVVDNFAVDTGIVLHYNDKNTSLEKIQIGEDYFITGTIESRVYNVQSGYLANPGKIYSTGEIIVPEDPIPVYTGNFPINCADYTQKNEVWISEIFAGNEVYPPYIELSVGKDLEYDSLFLSGSALVETMEIALDSGFVGKENNTIFLISNSEKWHNEGVNNLDTVRLTLQNSGGWLLLYGGSGQSGQLLDIITLTGVITGSSLYYNAHTQDCAKVFDETGAFSPGFDRVFLKYLPVQIQTKIEYISLDCSGAVSCPSCPDHGNTGENTTGEEEDEPLVITTGSLQVKITDIDYDPEGSDIGNETITLLADFSGGESQILLSKPNRYLKIGTTKRYLSGVLQSGVPLTLQGSFSFPNSSKSGNSITVQLRYQDQLLDLYTYTFTPPPPKPPKPPKVTGNILTGTYLVTSVIDGDTIKILYSGNEQSVRFLGIDAPEVSLLRTKKKGCFAEEAKDYVKELLLGKEVHLEFDPTQNKADSYKRRLNYVYLDDELLNETLLSNGYAKEYTFKVPYQLRDRFLSAQQEAQDEQLGLWNPSLCPENALQTGNMTGEILTGDLFTGASFSGLSVQITYVLPNPKGKDNKEEIGIWIAAYSSGGLLRQTVESGNVISGFYLEINGKKKKLSTDLEIGKENILSGNLGLLNKAACVGIGYSGIMLSKLCYEQPKEGQKIFADGHQIFQITDQEQTMLKELSFKKKGNQLCMMFGKMEVDCRNIPNGKTALKTANENKLYEKFITLINTYLKNERGDIYYQTNIKTYFDLLWSDKKNIKNGVQNIDTSHGTIPVYDLDQQLHILETYSLAYRAVKFGMVLLGEVTSP